MNSLNIVASVRLRNSQIKEYIDFEYLGIILRFSIHTEAPYTLYIKAKQFLLLRVR